MKWTEDPMSQDNVERFLGRLLTDCEFAAECGQSLEGACLRGGYLMTDSELTALKEIDFKRFATLTPYLDNRLKRAGSGNAQGGAQ